jgi:hypothetical protein
MIKKVVEQILTVDQRVKDSTLVKDLIFRSSLKIRKKALYPKIDFPRCYI